MIYIAEVSSNISASDTQQVLTSDLDLRQQIMRRLPLLPPLCRRAKLARHKKLHIRFLRRAPKRNLLRDREVADRRNDDFDLMLAQDGRSVTTYQEMLRQQPLVVGHYQLGTAV